MIYTISVRISRTVNFNAGELDKDGQPAKADMRVVPAKNMTFHHKSAEALTADQIKALIFERCKLANNLIDETLLNAGTKISGSDLANKYTITYSATIPMIAETTTTTTEQPVIETTTIKAVETTTQKVVETTTEQPSN